MGLKWQCKACSREFRRNVLLICRETSQVVCRGCIGTIKANGRVLTFSRLSDVIKTFKRFLKEAANAGMVDETKITTAIRKAGI